MSRSCSSSSTFWSLRPTEIVRFLVAQLEAQRFPMNGWRSCRSLHFNFFFLFEVKTAKKSHTESQTKKSAT